MHMWCVQLQRGICPLDNGMVIMEELYFEEIRLSRVLANEVAADIEKMPTKVKEAFEALTKIYTAQIEEGVQ